MDIDVVVENGKPLTLLPNTEIHFVTDVEGKVGRDCLGFFTYNTALGGFQKQAFYMSVNGQTTSIREHKEIDLLVTFGGFIEQQFNEARVQVAEINLPRSHGYSGNTYSYHTTMRLFQNAGI